MDVASTRTAEMEETATRPDAIPVETIEEAAEREQEEDEVRGLGQTRRGLDN
jgi:hypothetical protein